ncbi:MAG: S9 family peptidase [Phycisphaerales bacterium]|nr:S9 family peptidase [Phycisphaerales bacterium]
MLTLPVLVPVFAAVLATNPPATPQKPVTDEYHGTKVVDPYRWLEDWNAKDVREWSASQNSYAREMLDALPNVGAIRERVTALLSVSTPSYGSVGTFGGQFFAVKRQPPKQQPFLVVMPSPMHPDKERVLVDPNTMSDHGGVSMDWAIPSPDGTLVAVSLSKGGSESGDVSVFEVASGKQVFEEIVRVNGGTAGGSLAWAPDSKGFFYTRYPRAGERPETDMDFYVQLYFHELGTPVEKDRYELGKDFPRIAEIVVECLPEGPARGAALVSMQKGDGGEFQHYLRSAKGEWTQLTKYEDRVVQATFAPDGGVVMVSRLNAPKGKLLMLDASAPALAKARTLVPEGEDTLADEFFEASNLLATPHAIYAQYQLGGPSEVRVFDYQGKQLAKPALPPVSAAHGLTGIGGGKVMMSVGSYVSPTAWMVFDPASPTTLAKAPISSQYPFSFDDYEVVREFAPSKDGTNIPVNILRKKGKTLDGAGTLLVTGYGGYGVNLEPSFNGGRLALLEQGVVWAQANLRGGGEYGDRWHREGNLTNKQNVFDDFAGVVAHLQKQGYAKPGRTAIEGGSNGGLLMGATLTQRPELLGCVISHVGIYDMLRVELSANGAFNIPEFGTVTDPSHFRALHAYSPYHNVKDGGKYPPVLFLTGANDPRVDPMQSRKMTARLQAAGARAYLRTSMSSGHGIGTALSERIEQQVDVQAFLFNTLGVKHRPVK